MTVLDNLVTLIVLVGLGVLAYCKLQKKTLVDFFQEIKELITGGKEEDE